MERQHKKLSERIADKIEQDGDCLIWNGAMVGNCPIVAHRQADGMYRNINIRTFRGMKLYEGTKRTTRFSTSCGNPRCIAKDHIVVGGYEKEQKSYRADAKTNDMEFNKQVFALSVTKSAERVAEELQVSASLVRKILTYNTAMYPYFSVKIAEVVNVEDLLSLRVSRKDAIDDLGLTPFTYRFIMDGGMVPVNDAELYIATLDQCDVRETHLIAKDANSNTLTVLIASLIGANKCRDRYEQICDQEGCVNPLHFKGVKE